MGWFRVRLDQKSCFHGNRFFRKAAFIVALPGSSQWRTDLSGHLNTSSYNVRPVRLIPATFLRHVRLIVRPVRFIPAYIFTTCPPHQGVHLYAPSASSKRTFLRHVRLIQAFIFTLCPLHSSGRGHNGRPPTSMQTSACFHADVRWNPCGLLADAEYWNEMSARCPMPCGQMSDMKSIGRPLHFLFSFLSSCGRASDIVFQYSARMSARNSSGKQPGLRTFEIRADTLSFL